MPFNKAKKCLELIDLMEIMCRGFNIFVCDSWVKFKLKYYMYWDEDFIFCQHIYCIIVGARMINFMAYLKLVKKRILDFATHN